MDKQNYFLGLDIGTDSVGYAVTNEQFDLRKFRGEPAWGVTLFDEAQLNAERRAFRTARRRLDRRQARVLLIQELFAKEIARVDPDFFVRISKSCLAREDAGTPHTLFDDFDYTDNQYHKQYPTIHHLLVDLMHNPNSHDVRLLYLACAWLVAHRGHFLSEVSLENIAGLTNFDVVWKDLNEYIQSQAENTQIPWKTDCEDALQSILKKRTSITVKFKQVCICLFANGKCPKYVEGFPYNCEILLKGLCGGKINAQQLFDDEAYAELQSFSLGDKDEKLAEVFGELGENSYLLRKMKAIYDWAVLVDILNGEATISAAKVKQFEQHHDDLQVLKRMVRQYMPEQYNSIFREAEAANYLAYTMHGDPEQVIKSKKVAKDEFSDYLIKKLKNINPSPEDTGVLSDIRERLSNRTFLPKQHDTDNRVIPYQLYLYELQLILQVASQYLPFLQDVDDDGLSVADKILSVFTFRVPYFVGPLNNPTSRPNEHAWLIRKAGRILPWNFNEMVDLDASEEKFIRRMTNTCTYLPDAPVLPKDSLIYQRFLVLNEINNLKIDGEPISVEAKQAIYSNLFSKYRKVSRKRLLDYLLANGYMHSGQTVSGIDEQIKSSLSSYADFRDLLGQGVLNIDQAERIIERSACTEDKNRLTKWLKKEFPHLDSKAIEKIARLNYDGFGRLSRDLLCGLEATSNDGIHVYTILQAMWDTNENLMELLSDKYDFQSLIKERQQNFYQENCFSLAERMDHMYLSNAVKRPVLRALDITKDVVKAFGAPPAKIFIEMARGSTPDQKNKRTKSRKQQLLELYAQCQDEDVRIIQQQLEEMGDAADTLLQGDRLFLYYMQLGKCIYTGQALDIQQLKGSAYNIEHIYPRKQVKDDSIINNEVLVLSEVNGQKSDSYPISAEIRSNMRAFWDKLKKYGLLSDEKYKRLTRFTPFTEEEKMGFIQRQLTETTQSTKAVAELLKERYPDTEIVYVKARLASEFRQSFDCIKSRLYNDLHHAKDAYLNIVVGNVYNMKFSKRWFDVNSDYNIKTEVLYTHPVICGGKTVWDGIPMLNKVKKTLGRNNAHITKYSYTKKGGYFDQMPVKAAPGLIPLKQGLDTEKYGGYNKPAISFFIPVHYAVGKKEDTIILPVELLYSKKFLESEDFARQYAISRIEQIKGKKAESVTFPMGMRIWKVNTMLSLDGFRILIAGNAGGGKCLIAQPFMQFSASPEIEFYLKKLEMLVEKFKNRSNYLYRPEYDKVTSEENVKLYDLYIEKLSHSIYSKRPNNPVRLLQDGRNKFLALSAPEQAAALLKIHDTFRRVSSGCDYSPIGGTPRAAATVSFSSTVANWREKYKDIRIIDSSPSGLWEKQSGNLLDIL